MRLRAPLRPRALKGATGPSYCVLRAAVRVAASHAPRLRRVVAQRGAVVFNPDEKRTQARLARSDPIVALLWKCLRAAGYLRGRTPGAAVALHSEAGCRAQHVHTDYDPDACARSPVQPLGVLLALEHGTRFRVGVGDGVGDGDGRGDGTGDDVVGLNKGDVLVFDGDLPHAGDGYDVRNTRVHAYVDVPAVARPGNATYLLQVDGP